MLDIIIFFETRILIPGRSNHRPCRSIYRNIYWNICRDFCGDFCRDFCRDFCGDFCRDFCRDFCGDFCRDFCWDFVRDFCRDFCNGLLLSPPSCFSGRKNAVFLTLIRIVHGWPYSDS
jgi:hypothetical protein